jgi:hypothetical protein
MSDIVEEFKKLADIFKEQSRLADENMRSSRDSAIANNGAFQGVQKCIEIVMKSNAPELTLIEGGKDAESK